MRFKIVLWPALTLISFLIAIIVNLAAFFAKNGGDLFGSKFTLKDTNSEYDIFVSLSIEYSIFIWITIYSWNLSWQCYIIYIVGFQFNYMKNTLFGNYFYQNFIISNIFNIAYIVLLINDYFFISGLMLLFLTIFLYISNYLSHKFLMFKVPLALYSNPNTRSSSTVEIVKNVPFWLKHHDNFRRTLYCLLLNAIPFYCTYTTIELCIMFGSFLKYHENTPNKNISDEMASYITMFILSFGLISYWLFDFCKFSKDYFINTYSPYFVIDTTLIAMIIHIHSVNGHQGLFIYAIILLSITFYLTLLKIYNGYKIYIDDEYIPRHTIVASNTFKKSASIDLDLSGKSKYLSTTTTNSDPLLNTD